LIVLEVWKVSIGDHNVDRLDSTLGHGKC